MVIIDELTEKNLILFAAQSYRKPNFSDIEEFYDLSSWERYRNYLSSDLADQIQRPPDWLMKFSEFGSIGLDRSDQVCYNEQTNKTKEV